MELSDYRAPHGFHCDPKVSPEGGDWLEACPRSFQWLDQQHGITAKSVTGLELSRYESLDECDAQGLARQRYKFWPLLKTLAHGFFLSPTDMRDTAEVRQMYPDCPTRQEDLLSHPCLGSWAKADRLSLVVEIV